MKKKVFTIVSVVVVAVLYYFSISGLKGAENTNPTVSSTAQDTFTNTIFNTGYNVMLEKPGLDLFINLDSFKELNFNAIQWYDWAGSDTFGNPLQYIDGDQINRYKNAISTVNNKGLLGFYERVNLSYYIYGQRLIYEVSQTNNNTNLNYGFVYQQCMENTYMMDGSRTVLHASPSLNDSGYLCSGIYENLQHTDLFGFRQEDKGEWFLKPVMRIDTTVHDTTRVVRIEIMAFNRLEPVKTIIIKAENFRNNGIYNGNYLEKYFRLQFPLQIFGDHATDSCLSKGYDGEWWEWDTSCHVDFRVYWYGVCDVWFDQMIVDDRRANDLFNQTNVFPKPDSLIYQDVTNFTDLQGNYSFFTDEVVMSQVPCMKYVFKKMREYNSKSRISFALTNALHIKSLKHDELSYGIFFDSLKPDFIQLDAHKFIKFSANDIGIPDVVTHHDLLIPDSWYESVSTYNNKLQNRVFGYKSENPVDNDQGSLIYEINKLRTSNTNPLSNVKYIIQPQIHGWLFCDTNVYPVKYNNGLREPTNEEIQSQAMISIAHGANGLCWFVYNSHTWDIDSNGTADKYMIGLLDPENDTEKRIENDYGQNKWAYVSAMNGKINNAYSFD